MQRVLSARVRSQEVVARLAGRCQRLEALADERAVAVRFQGADMQATAEMDS